MFSFAFRSHFQEQALKEKKIIETPGQCLMISWLNRPDPTFNEQGKILRVSITFPISGCRWRDRRLSVCLRRSVNTRACTQAKQTAVRGLTGGDRSAVTSWLSSIPLGPLAHTRDREDNVCKTTKNFGYKNNFKSQTGPLEWPIQ